MYVKDCLIIEAQLIWWKLGYQATTLKVPTFEQQGVSPIIKSLENNQPLNWNIYNDVHIM